MEFRKVLALRGPNVWAMFPVLEAWLDLGEFRDASSEELPGFNGRVTSRFPSQVEHRCSERTRGGFFERLRRGTYPAHVLEHVALELQSLAGSEVGFGRARATSEEGVYRVAVEYREEALGRAALEAARAFCLAAVATGRLTSSPRSPGSARSSRPRRSDRARARSSRRPAAAGSRPAGSARGASSSSATARPVG